MDGHERRPARAALLAALLALVAAPAAQALQAQQIRAPGFRVQTRPEGWIGLSFELREALGRTGEERVPAIVITGVHPGSPADGAGIQTGDTIVLVDDRPAGPEALGRLQAALEPGRRVTFGVRRGGAVRAVSLRAARRPADELLVTMPARVRLRVDSAHALFMQHLDSARLRAPDPGTFPYPVTASRVLVVGRPGDSLQVFGVWTGDREGARGAFRWVEPPSLPATSSLEAVLESMQGRWRIEGAAREALARQAVLVEALRAAEDARRSALEAVRQAENRGTARVRAAAPQRPPVPATPPEEHRRPLAPYILGQDWIAGARLTAVNAGLGDYFGVERGLLVVEVVEGTPAADAGIVPGDVILLAGQREVATMAELRGALAAPAASEPLPITLVRRGARLRVLLPRE